MGARGSVVQRTLTFFREAQIDEARVTFQLAEEIMTKRLDDQENGAKSQAKAAATPRKKRRTKAQIAADNNLENRPGGEVLQGETLADA
jgi:hypothetical protein